MPKKTIQEMIGAVRRARRWSATTWLMGSPYRRVPPWAPALRRVDQYRPEAVDPATVVVTRRSDLEEAAADRESCALTDAVVNFINTMLDDGHYRPEKLLTKAVQAYCADFYRDVVATNGHAVFIGRCGELSGYFWPHALDGLRAMDADAHATALEGMIAWAHENPQALVGRRGRGVLDEEGRLDVLDDMFAKAEEIEPLIERLSAWIADWRELRVVADAGYDAAMAHLTAMNPDPVDRSAADRIASFRHQIDDWLHVSVGLAAAAAAEPELRLGVHAGGMVHIAGSEGERLMVWGLHTSKGRRFARVRDDGVWLYQWIEDDGRSAPDAGSLAEAMARMQRPRHMKAPAQVGACLSHVDGDRVQAVIEAAGRQNAAAAVDLLLRRIGCEEETLSLTAAGFSTGNDGAAALKWLVVAGDEPVTVLTSETGARLTRSGETVAAASASSDEIARHLATSREAAGL